MAAKDRAIGDREIPDTNLRLAMLEALRGIGLGTPAKPGRDVYDDDDDYGFGLRVDAVLKEPFPAAGLAKITRLWWDHAQQDIVHEVWPGWDGETEEFDIESFAGIQHCSALEEIDILRFMGTDLSPLAKLPALRTLIIDESLPSGVKTRNAAVLRSLAKRGVVIVIDTLKHWTAAKAARKAAETRAEKAKNAKATATATAPAKTAKTPKAKPKPKAKAKAKAKKVTRRTPSTRTGRRR